MSMPKFKKTKWKLKYCTECKKIIGTTTTGHRRYHWRNRCNQQKHNIVERENIPFKIPDLKVTGHYSWMRAKSVTLKQEFDISPTEVTKIIMGPGVEPGGLIRNSWWMWSKKGSSLSLTWIGVDTNANAKV